MSEYIVTSLWGFQLVDGKPMAFGGPDQIGNFNGFEDFISKVKTFEKVDKKGKKSYWKFLGVVPGTEGEPIQVVFEGFDRKGKPTGPGKVSILFY